jgi:hypothetical protein
MQRVAGPWPVVRLRLTWLIVLLVPVAIGACNNGSSGSRGY